MSADFYDLLDVPEDASQDDIRDAFRSKVQEYHPDHNDDPRASAQFTALKKAYDTLGDPVERNAYDRMGHLDYVGKRLDGLPDPEKWAPETDSGSGGGATSGTASSRSSGGPTTSSTSSSRSGRSSASSRNSSRNSSSRGSSSRSSSSSASSRSSSSRGSTSSGSSSRSSSARSRSSSGSSRTSSSSTGTASGTSSGTSTGSSGSSAGSSGGSTGRRTASDGAGTATHDHVDYQVDPVVEWIAEHDRIRRVVGWELLWIVLGVYAVGLGAFATAYRGPLSDLTGRVAAAGTDVGALLEALERESMPIVAEVAIAPVAGTSSGPFATLAGVFLLVTAFLLPAAVGLLVYVTRTTPGWKPNFGYPVATCAPLVGVVAGQVSTPTVWLEFLLFVGFPLGAVFVMLLSAFVRPRVLIFLYNVRS